MSEEFAGLRADYKTNLPRLGSKLPNDRLFPNMRSIVKNCAAGQSSERILVLSKLRVFVMVISTRIGYLCERKVA